MDNPYTFTFEFNFIRYLKHTIEPDLSYNKDYELSIRVADDNYIDKNIWPNWNSFLIKNLVSQIPDISKFISDNIIKLYIEGFKQRYNVVTIKQIEFNKDYYVGHHKASDILHQLRYFIISSSGVGWVNSLSAHSTSVYKAKEIESVKSHTYGDNYNPTLKFFIAKGLYFKIYVKTTDHIRLELTITKDYIKHKFKKHGFESVKEPLRYIAKDFFKKSDFINKIKESIDLNYSDYFSIIDNVYNFLDKTYPELSSIIDSVSHLNPIKNPEVIRFIKSNKRLNPYFKRMYLNNGKKILIYSYIKKEVKRKHKIRYPEDRKQYITDLWKNYKKHNPKDSFFVRNDLSGFIHKKNI